MTQRRRPASPQELKPLTTQLRHFFGLRSGTGEAEFRAELRQLEDVDRAWFARALQEVGYRVDLSTVSKVSPD